MFEVSANTSPARLVECDSPIYSRDFGANDLQYFLRRYLVQILIAIMTSETEVPSSRLALHLDPGSDPGRNLDILKANAKGL